MPSSKPERPPSRPPLTSRIRASFESKRRLSSDGLKSPVSVTNGEVVAAPDPEALRDAVDKAINSEAFQSAIAANLARLIKPSIKDALDTLQPVVEAVHKHEMLLRKMNSSVENILDRMDDGAEADVSGSTVGGEDDHAAERRDAPSAPVVDKAVEKPAASVVTALENGGKRAQIEEKLVEVSNVVKAHSGRFAEVIDGIAGIRTTLRPTREGVETLQSVADQFHTSVSAMQAQLDQLGAEIEEIKKSVGSGLGKDVAAIREHATAQDTSILSSHTTKLDAITTDLAAIRGHSTSMDKLDAISADLGSLKESVQSGIASSSDQLAALTPQVTAILTSVEKHTDSLAEMKAADTTPQIWAAVQKSNESHEAHTAVLGEINARSRAPVSDKGSDSAAALEALAADLTSLKQNIQAGLTSNNENVTAVGSKVDDILTTLEAHRAADPGQAILEGVNKANESHAAHAEALEGIKSLNGTQTESPNTIEPQLSTILSTLESHTASHTAHSAALESQAAALENVRSLNAGTEAPSALEPQLATIIGTLESHSAAHAAHSAALESHATTLEGLRSLGTEPPPPADSLEPKLDTILTTLQSHTDAHASHTAALEGVRSLDSETTPVDSAALEPKLDTIISTLASHTASHTAHAAALEGVRSPNDDSETQPDLRPQLDTIISTLESHAAALNELKSTVSSGFEATPSNGAETLLEPHINSIVETLKHHTDLLSEIKDDISPEILSTLHDIKDSHESHQSVLTEIRDADVSDEILTALHSSNDSHTNHAAALAGIQDAVNASNESHAAHAGVLEEIKTARSVETVSGDGAKAVDFGPIIATLEEHGNSLNAIKEAAQASAQSHSAHAATLAEIKDAGLASNESHAAHTATLAELKDSATSLNDLHVAHTASLDNIKESTNASREFHTLHEASLDEIKGTVSSSRDLHTAQAASLDEIKDFHTSHAANLAELKAATNTEPTNIDLSALEIHLTSISAALQSQSAVLSEIQAASSNREVLGAIKNCNELLTSHTTVLNTIKDTSSHEDILNNISSLKSILEDSKSGIDAHGTSLKNLHDSTQSSHSELTSAIAGLAVGSVAGDMLANHNDDSKEVLEEIKAVKEIVEKSAAQIDVNHFTITTLNNELKTAILASETEIKSCLTALGEGIDTRATSDAYESRGTEVPDIGVGSHDLYGHVLNAHDSAGESEAGHFAERELHPLDEHPAGSAPLAGSLAAGALVAGTLAAGGLGMAINHSESSEAREATPEEEQVEHESAITEPEVDKEADPQAADSHPVDSEPVLEAVSDAEEDELHIQSKPMQEETAAENEPASESEQSVDPGSVPTVEEVPSSETKEVKEVEQEHETDPTISSDHTQSLDIDNSVGEKESDLEPSVDATLPPEAETSKEVEQEIEKQPEAESVLSKTHAIEAEEPSIENEVAVEAQPEPELPKSEEVPTTESDEIKEASPEVESNPVVQSEHPVDSEPAVEAAEDLVAEHEAVPEVSLAEPDAEHEHNPASELSSAENLFGTTGVDESEPINEHEDTSESTDVVGSEQPPIGSETFPEAAPTEPEIEHEDIAQLTSDEAKLGLEAGNEIEPPAKEDVIQESEVVIEGEQPPIESEPISETAPVDLNGEHEGGGVLPVEETPSDKKIVEESESEKAHQESPEDKETSGPDSPTIKGENVEDISPAEHGVGSHLASEPASDVPTDIVEKSELAAETEAIPETAAPKDESIEQHPSTGHAIVNEESLEPETRCDDLPSEEKAVEAPEIVEPHEEEKTGTMVAKDELPSEVAAEDDPTPAESELAGTPNMEPVNKRQLSEVDSLEELTPTEPVHELPQESDSGKDDLHAESEGSGTDKSQPISEHQSVGETIENRSEDSAPEVLAEESKKEEQNPSMEHIKQPESQSEESTSTTLAAEHNLKPEEPRIDEGSHEQDTPLPLNEEAVSKTVEPELDSHDHSPEDVIEADSPRRTALHENHDETAGVDTTVSEEDSHDQPTHLDSEPKKASEDSNLHEEAPIADEPTLHEEPPVHEAAQNSKDTPIHAGASTLEEAPVYQGSPIHESDEVSTTEHHNPSQQETVHLTTDTSNPPLAGKVSEQDTPTPGDISPIEEYELFRDEPKSWRTAFADKETSPVEESQKPPVSLSSPEHSLVHDDNRHVSHEPAHLLDSSDTAGGMETPPASPI